MSQLDTVPRTQHLPILQSDQSEFRDALSHTGEDGTATWGLREGLWPLNKLGELGRRGGEEGTLRSSHFPSSTQAQVLGTGTRTLPTQPLGFILHKQHRQTPEYRTYTLEIMRFLVPRTWIPSVPMERKMRRSGLGRGEGQARVRWGGGGCTPRQLQETSGRGWPVAMHSSTAVWCTMRVRF
jgi:hypothetical protein